jgi:hypothetical protein
MFSLNYIISKYLRLSHCGNLDTVKHLWQPSDDLMCRHPLQCVCVCVCGGGGGGGGGAAPPPTPYVDIMSVHPSVTCCQHLICWKDFLKSGIGDSLEVVGQL